MISGTTLAQVAAGGAIGASARYVVNVTSGRLLGTGFPYATLIINVAGSFLMGLLVVLLAEKSGNRLAPFLMTGVLGGFTTFSAFSLDTITLYERGQTGLALVYVAGSVLLSLAAIALALHLFRGVFA
ncbi:fluoride efflux transporter CrcB [Pseudogemmobacter blasticus]|uniref:Fluoride-specific ion channel FluC n=1 Tax=Fuscovulum blasticum DSM 2131 TaxID=1188250 RepID=A0A2T4J6W5_FUSBL|nr:fluoride efflux transporter CrcB [Fuscovulum blasticum]PTE13639.1 fluoride efflux transporter CrcB [Fuscovulum blasticum DSM 2131]